jgi:hypothetical protein
MENDRYLEPIKPGEILKEDFMEPLGISMNQAFQKPFGASQPDQRNCEWETFHFSGHRTPAGAVFWSGSPILAEFANRV